MSNNTVPEHVILTSHRGWSITACRVYRRQLAPGIFIEGWQVSAEGRISGPLGGACSLSQSATGTSDEVLNLMYGAINQEIAAAERAALRMAPRRNVP
jgi:hypothetical protein